MHVSRHGVLPGILRPADRSSPLRHLEHVFAQSASPLLSIQATSVWTLSSSSVLRQCSRHSWVHLAPSIFFRLWTFRFSAYIQVYMHVNRPCLSWPTAWPADRSSPSKHHRSCIPHFLHSTSLCIFSICTHS